MTVLQFVRPKRKPALDIRRGLIRGGIEKARAAGDTNRAGHLQTILATANCPTAAWRRLCPCGCGRTPGQHNPMNGDAA